MYAIYQLPQPERSPAAVSTALPRCADGNGTLTPLFFSDDIIDIARAKAICGKCALAASCLREAQEREEPWGVWGGELLLNGRIVTQQAAVRSAAQAPPSRADHRRARRGRLASPDPRADDRRECLLRAPSRSGHSGGALGRRGPPTWGVGSLLVWLRRVGSACIVLVGGGR